MAEEAHGTAATRAELESLPLSPELLQYYRQKLEKAEQDYLDTLEQVDLLKVPHAETHKLHWDLNQRVNEVADLQAALSDCQTALFDERKQLLKVIAENDELKIQELRDRRKIRYLLAISSIPEDETTYFRDTLDKRLVKVAHVRSQNAQADSTGASAGVGDKTALRGGRRARAVFIDDEETRAHVDDDGNAPAVHGIKQGVNVGEAHAASGGRPVAGNSGRVVSVDDGDVAGERDITIMEDEISALKLTITSLRAQLEEQRKSYEETVQGLLHDRRTRLDEEKARRKYEAERVDELTKKVEKLRILCRENTRELLFTKKKAQATERKLTEEKANLLAEVAQLQGKVSAETKRTETAERTIEARVARRNEALVADLRAQLGKYEAEVRELKQSTSKNESQQKKRVEYLQQRLDIVNSSYKALQKRRHHEIEGFTNDIMLLRKQLKSLERTILKFGPVEDRECVLLGMAKATGEKAARISNDLVRLKNKVYETEAEMRNLAF